MEIAQSIPGVREAQPLANGFNTFGVANRHSDERTGCVQAVALENRIVARGNGDIHCCDQRAVAPVRGNCQHFLEIALVGGYFNGQLTLNSEDCS